jgi:hypothetical protein
VARSTIGQLPERVAGPPGQSDRIINEVRSIARPVAEMIGPMPYPAITSAFDALVPPGLPPYQKASFVRDLSDAAIEAQRGHPPTVPAVNAAVAVYPINGAAHRAPADASAFASETPPHRHRRPVARPVGQRREHRLGPGLRQRPRPPRRVATSTSWAGDDQNRIRADHRGDWNRLVRVTRAYGPDNLFHLNQNIRP